MIHSRSSLPPDVLFVPSSFVVKTTTTNKGLMKDTKYHRTKDECAGLHNIVSSVP